MSISANAGEVEKAMPESTYKPFLSERLEHFTWAWYTLTMSTGGFATLLAVQPHTFHGLRTIGKIVYIWDLVLFVVITAMTVLRFTRRPNLFLRSLSNPSESLFIPCAMLSLATIIAGMADYGGPSTGSWLTIVLRVLFWIYVALAFLLAVTQYFYLFTAKRLTVQDMLPAWLLPIFPAMLCGTVASAVAPLQTSSQRMSILVAGLTFQGLGFWAAIPLYGTFITRLMQYGIPAPNLRPGMFIAVGPPSFTCLALISMSESIPQDVTYFIRHPSAIEALRQSALAFGIFIWSLAFWFFCISTLSVLIAIRQTSFHLVWYAFIFPNVGFTYATITIGRGLYSPGILWVGSAMTICLAALYIFVLCAHARAIYIGAILWPGKDEDKDT